MISHNNEGKTTNPNQRPFFKGVTDLFKKGGTTIGEKVSKTLKLLVYLNFQTKSNIDNKFNTEICPY